jgi:hypothetical protein
VQCTLVAADFPGLGDARELGLGKMKAITPRDESNDEI